METQIGLELCTAGSLEMMTEDGLRTICPGVMMIHSPVFPMLEQAMLDLQAEQYFTVHHNKFALAMHPWQEPDQNARAIAAKHNLRLLDASIGEKVDF